jgi:hypothetical protein
MNISFSYYELIETFPRRGCAICNLLHDKVDKYLDHLLYERVTKPSTHDAFRASHGLCAVHGDLLLTTKGSALGIAILYRTCLKAGLAGLADPDVGRSWFLGSPSPKILAPTGLCPACEQMLEAEETLIDTLRKYADDNKLTDAYRSSDGLCLPHMGILMAAGTPAAARNRLASIQAGHWQALLVELETFIEKQDYRRAQDAIGKERDSWRRVVRLISGDPVVFGGRRPS